MRIDEKMTPTVKALQPSAHGVLFRSIFLLIMGLLSTFALHSQTYSVLYNFTAVDGDGKQPYGGLIADAKGNIYGTTECVMLGTYYNGGSIFKIDPSGKQTTLYSFNTPFSTTPIEGGCPYGGVVMDSAGNLLGTASGGGGSGVGVVFKYDTSNNLNVLTNFTRFGGWPPYSGLAIDAASNLYGTTAYGGLGFGTIYRIDPAGNETDLYLFKKNSDGDFPSAQLTLDGAGNIYGASFEGGDSGDGAIFKLDTSGNFTLLHSFSKTDGSRPTDAAMLRDSAGNLYGTTYAGGDFDNGVVFKLDPTGNNFAVLHSFTAVEGYHPNGGLAMDAAGNLYGSTQAGGPDSSSAGTVFKLDSAGNLTLLHAFDSPTDGNTPVSGLLLKSGSLYGETIAGGASGQGTVFKITLPEQLSNFSTEVVPIKFLRLTTIFGQFTPAESIVLSSQAVTFSVSGASNSTWSFPAGSFTRSLAGYSANASNGTTRATLVLAPSKSGQWSYAAVIHTLYPASTPLKVTLTIGDQTGSAQ
jgi:uncharacterized repeat protein (TIGR03803 family)